MLPTAADIAEAIQASEREEKEREAWLRSPAAKQAREQSRLAFADLGAASAQEILNTVFGSHLAQLNADPARALADAQLLAVQDETDATVREDGDTKVLESSMPLRTEDKDGDLAKVDVGLEATADGFVTKNALVDVKVPASPERPVEVGDRGVSIKLAGADEGRALQPFGEQNALASEVLTDTDMLVSPIASGVEIFNLLRSERSPETVRYPVGMPPGAVLRAGDGQGAEVVKDGELLATIPEPVAVDAQGTDVPVGLEIEGDTLALTVSHREGDYAMPILLDPVIEDNTWWIYGQNLDALHESIWGFSKNVAGIHGSTHCIYHCWGLSNPRGLFVSAQAGTYWAWQYGHWFYAAPNQHSYVSGANFHPFVRYDHGCNAATTQHKQPHDYVGLWDGSDWAMLHTNKANHPAGGPTVTGVGESVVMGLSTAASNFSIPCWRDVYLQGAYVSLDDWGPPVLESVTGIPSGWVSDETQYAIGAQAFDQGLGVQNIAIHPQGWNEFHNELPQDQCAGNKRDPCSHSYTASFPNPGARFLEGERTGNFLQAYDPTLKPSANHNFTTRVDKTPPSVSLEGQLAEVTEEDEGEAQGNEEVEKLRLPVYNLTVKATDGDPDGEDKHKRSGVEDIEIHLDGEELEVPWAPQSCSGPDYSCPMTKTYPVALSKLTTAGVHTLKVEAVDQVGKRKRRQIEFEYFPATGMKDEYVMHHFPLPNGQGDEESEEHPARPELAVNVMNGNLVYRERDVDIEGVAVDLEVERYYNSQLPEAEDTEWGDGWTLAQTPDLKPEEGASPAQAELIDTSGALEEEVELPTAVEEETFDPELQATLKKKEGGGYDLTDETGESPTSVAFNENGRTEALLTEGQAKVDYTYAAGELTEIAVKDPGSAGNPTEPPEEPEEEGGPVPSPLTGALYVSAFGSEGPGDGQLSAPADVATDSEGDLFVVDRGNDRVQKFAPDGQFLAKFGASGTADGQLDEPSAIEIDPQGDLWVLDAGNERVQRFSPGGEYLAQLGSPGPEAGSFVEPDGLAIDPDGDIWVADAFGRFQEFDSEGALLRELVPIGIEAEGFDVDAEGNLWFGLLGECVAKIDTEISVLGSNCEVDVAGIDIDAEGNVWIGEQGGGVRLFDSEAQPAFSFGEAGEGEGQFDLTGPMGIAAGGANRLWIADPGNDRVAEWVTGSYVPNEAEEEPDDPAVDVDVEGGLVSALEGEEAGAHDYAHEGEQLASHDGPQGESEYDYQEGGSKLLTKVTLPNGTWAAIAYFADDRVKAVTVDVAGDEKPAKTTYFEYSQEPRRTFVEVLGAPNVTYDFAEDGSLLKWWHKQQPPEFLSISGSLWIEKGKELPIGDHTLQVIADSPEGIDSIQFIANGDILVDEKTCEQDPEKPGVECTELENVWVTDTASNAPGILNLEVIVTDSDGNSESERFWVEVPYTPPPPPGVPIAPKFKQVERFREEYGLEIVFPVANELELVERIFDLIHAWHSPYTYEGQVARASAERWGVPLRPADVAELEYREWLYDVNAEKIDQWVEATSPGSYAGYTLDHAAGGIMRIGFLGNQEEQLASLESSLSLVGNSRLSVYPTPPTTSYLSVRATTQSVMGAIESNPTLANLVISVEDDEAGRATRIGTPNVAQVEGILDQMVGPSAPVTVEYEAGGGALLAGRYRNEGRMRAGDYINGAEYTELGLPTGKNKPCTAGFGAEYRKKRPKSNGGEIVRLFLLTAGHCYSKIDQEVWRNKYDGDFAFPYDDAGKSEVGRLQRNALEYVELGGVRTDGAAIRIKQGNIVPREIWGWEGHALPTKPPGKARKRNVVCYSGAISKTVACGKIVARSLNWHPDGAPFSLAGYWVRFPYDRRPQEGDSGSPVWNLRTGASIGLVSGSRPADSATETMVAPLLHPPNMPANRVPGILHHWGMAPLQLKLDG